MGRQIQVALTQIDEKAFLEFLHSKADIKLLESFAPSVEQLWASDFAPELAGHWVYEIWNQEFPWVQTFGQVAEKAYNEKYIGWYFVRKLGAAPVIEFIRSDVEKGKFGRLYWGKYFSAPGGLNYDVDAFSKWYNLVVGWIKRNSAGKLKDGLVTWFLPDAWNLYTSTQISAKEKAITVLDQAGDHE